MAIIRNIRESSDDKPNTSNSRKINKKIDLLNQKIDGLYKDIYISRPDNKHNLDSILSKLDTAIDQLQDDDMSISGMSELLRRIDSKDGSNVQKLMNDVGELFNDQNLISALFANNSAHKFIAGQNYQYDMICRYLPKLKDALKVKRDNVLCSDNFSKEYINPKSRKSSKKEIEQFSANTKKIEKEYEISEFIDKTYMNVSRYGEDFIYVVPYTTAFKKLIKRSNLRNNGARLGQVSFYESGNNIQCISEGYAETEEFKAYKNNIIESNQFDDPKNKFKGYPVNLHFNDSNVITEKINDILVLENLQQVERFTSLSSIFEQGIAEQTALNEANVSGSITAQMEEIKKQNDKITNRSAAATDGLIIPDSLQQRDPEKIDKTMLGAVVERLPRENVIPIYIGKRCMGYYYFEYAEDKGACGFCGSHHMTPGVSNAANYAYEMSEDQQELAIRYVANRMSQAIDTHFINANKDLKEEIYAVLRYNERFDIAKSNDIGVTFIPAEDIIHCYNEIDEDTHRGISELADSVVAAMLYILLYLTDIIGKITRSTDKRIYYVKQNVETNVARTMMNVVQQIKKGNMGMRQIESMNNILNIVGKYNDYIIPMGQSGDAPIQFEVMNGQEINTPTEIMEKMEEAAINPIMPFEMINSIYQQDFAVRFSMSNTRFLKSVYTLQRYSEKWIGKIYTKVYNYEFGEQNSYIEIKLPPPVYLVMQNNQQIIDNVTQQADKIVELEMVDYEDDVKAEFKRIYVRENLASYMNYADIERQINMAIVNIESKKKPQVEESDDASSMDDDY